MTMNGAESLVRTLLASGVDVCFSNPGTSEMHFVAALDRVEGMRAVLCLFEGVATGAADGFARMADRPAATLLHLGPGLGNGIANLHNAGKARTPVVNIVGEHATWHLAHDAPLTADIEGIARPVSRWVKTSRDAMQVAADGADAVAAAWSPPGGVATLILPADTAWNPSAGPAAPAYRAVRAKVEEGRLDEAVHLFGNGRKTLILMGGHALRARGLALAAGIAGRTGAELMAPGANARVERGGGRPAVERVPYVIDQALARLASFEQAILIGAAAPVGFFGYPGKPSRMLPEDCVVHTLAEPADDLEDCLARLADRVGAAPAPPRQGIARPALPRGPLTPDTIGAVVGALLPENAIVSDESVTTGRAFFKSTEGAPAHDWLQLTGGSIGLGMPLAVGAAVACPDRKVINLQADGSALYTLQSLWTQARENLDVLTCIWANRAYQILRGELANVGAGNPGRKALDMLSLDQPALDWVAIARGMGVDACRVETAEDFARAFAGAIGRRGPYLVEVVM